MGLLGDSIEDPRTMAVLRLAGALQNQRGGGFGGLLSGLNAGGQDYIQTIAAAKQQEEARRLQAEQRQMQQQLMQQQITQAQQQTAAGAEAVRRQQALQQLAKDSMQTPTGLPSMMAGSGQRTPDANAALQGGINAAAKPTFNFQRYAEGLAGLGDPMASLQMTQALQKDDTPVKLAPGEQLVSGRASGYKPLAKAGPKEDDFVANMRASGIDPQSPQGQVLMRQWLQKQSTHTPPVNVSVSMDKGFGEVFAKDAAQSLGASRDQARAAASNIQTLDRIVSIMDSGKVAVGPTAKFETFGRQLGEVSGLGGKNNAETLGNTRNMMQSAATLAADGAKLLAGQGQITEGERALIMRASGGDIDSMTAPEVRALTGTLRKVNALKIQSHQRQLKNVDPKFAPFVPFYNVDAPAAPTSVDDLLKKYGAN